MIYLNNAATSWPKPASVVQAVTAALDSKPVSTLRSNLSQHDDLPAQLRQALGRLFNISDYGRIFFCSGATDGLNRVLQGISWRHCDSSPDSHNSVLRPLHNCVSVQADGTYSLTAINHCSNVTGRVADVADACRQAHRRGALLLLDAAQSAGCIPIDVDGWGVDILVFTGHKALFGPMGTGGYYVRRGICLRPLLFGGTGRDSSIIDYGPENEWEYEVGTPNLPGLAGLKAGVDYVLERGVAAIFRKEQQQALWLIDALRRLPKVQLYVAPAPSVQGPVVSFNIAGLQPADVGYILQNSYGITVRTGLHCAPLIHRQLGTERYGTVRVSLSDFTSEADLQALVGAVADIAQSNS